MKKRIFTVMLAVVIALGCGMLGACSKKNSPSGTIEKFAEALNNNNVMQMAECIDTEVLSEIGDFANVGEVSLAESAGRIAKLIPFISCYLEKEDFLPEYEISILSEEIASDNENATVKIKAIDKTDFYEYVLNVYLKKVENKWYIQYAEPTIE